MRDIMDWNDCKEDFIRNVEIDSEKINSLIKTAQLRLSYLKNSIIDGNTVSVKNHRSIDRWNVLMLFF